MKNEANWTIVDSLDMWRFQRCRTLVCWTELNEHKVIGPDIVKDTEEKVQVIRQRLKAANDRQKSYADLKRRDIEYEVGDKVFLKVSLWRKILRFCKKGKLSPRFIGHMRFWNELALWLIVWHSLQS